LGNLFSTFSEILKSPNSFLELAVKTRSGKKRVKREKGGGGRGRTGNPWFLARH
jgi:hypothetical protein